MKPIYSRRNFLKACGLATAALCSDALRSATIKVASPEVEYVLRGGQTYIDGRWCSCDIGITPRGRLVVSKSPIPCHYVINVSGREMCIRDRVYQSLSLKISQESHAFLII